MVKRAILCVVMAVAMLAPAWGQQLTFDVASVKANKSSDPPRANFPLGPGDVYVPNGGFFNASNFPLLTYIFFAFKVKGNQAQYLQPELPVWVTSDRFDIQARASGNPGKDDMRMMMRSLLRDRFGLKFHYETREVPVLAFVLAKPGKTGPQLRKHEEGSPCPKEAPSQAQQQAGQAAPPIAGADGYPTFCGGIFLLPSTTPGHMKLGARSVTLAFMADALANGTAGRAMVDRTGLTGTYDFLLEYAPEPERGPGAPDTPPADLPGPTFVDAVREQLGIKLESQKAPVEMLVVDHIEHLTDN